MKPGSFSGAPESVEERKILPEGKNTPTVADDLVAQYAAFQKVFQPRVDTVYYPSCGYDISPSVAFPDSRIIYVDQDPAVRAAFAAKNLTVRTIPAQAFTPSEPVDVAILLNPQMIPNVPASHVREGGFVLANNTHGTALHLHHDSGFKLVGVMTPEGEIDQENVDEYLTSVDTDEEYRASAPEDFAAAQRVVKGVRERVGTVVQRYVHFLKDGKIAGMHSVWKKKKLYRLPPRKNAAIKSEPHFYIFQKV